MSKIEAHCYELVKKIREGRQISCDLCFQERGTPGVITVVQKDIIQIDYAMRHAYMHLGEIIHLCKQCDFRAPTENVIKKHLNVEHQLGGAKANYTVVSTKEDDEVIAMLTTC
jgi:hypothetical protein